MGSQLSTPPSAGVVDSEIARQAARQHGVMTRAQLLHVGLTEHAIDHRLQRGRLVAIHRGVYAIGHLPSSLLARATAAVLACGPGTAISHRTAALMREIIKRWKGPVEVIARREHRLEGVIVHRSRTLTRRDVRRLHGIPVTTPARTVLDLADVLDDRALTRAVNDARVKRLLTLEDLAAQLARSPGRRATRRLRPFIDARHGPTKSTLEDDFLRFVDRFGLPVPLINDEVAGYEVDAVWPDQRLVVELDTIDYHGHEAAFERDRDKDANLLAAGYATVRVTGQRLNTTPDREAARLHALLTARS